MCNFTRITYLSKLIVIHLLAALPQPQLLWGEKNRRTRRKAQVCPHDTCKWSPSIPPSDISLQAK
ncbi:hypothetical protein D4100_12100 [Serratia inhibens]|uniref:Uncharacterized protein n=1 Tax=Serratia inhibens TaxID=2338073 RepID=A0AA92X4L1_9GAMM|nr:hypothetical protein D4100_12100 [Serratia inhibens]